MTTSALKRRSFLQGSLLAAAVIGSTPAVAAEAAKPKFDESFDVIVVGSGIAGPMAALSAADKGANVLMIEKMSRLGGTSRISGLNFACVGSPAQKAKGVKDTPEQLASDMYKVSGNMGDYEKALEMAKNTGRDEAFMTQRGVKWDGRLLKLGGHSQPRVLVSEGDGAGLLNALWTYMKGLKNVTVRTHVKADEVLFNDKGVAVGVKVREKYFFDTPETDDNENKTGVEKRIEAKKGVIFATGATPETKHSALQRFRS